MATSESTVQYLEDQLERIGATSRKMFGEYAIYVNKKVVALVCDDRLFVKITDEGKKFVGRHYKEGTAYPSAKLSMLIDEDLIEDREWLTELIQITEKHVPLPTSKTKSAKKKTRGR